MSWPSVSTRTSEESDDRVRGEERAIMTENLSERVSQLEKSVKRAAEAIAVLRRERDALQAKVAVMETERGELQALKQERREVLSQVDSILKELDKLDL